jgi:hypothetical protein
MNNSILFNPFGSTSVKPSEDCDKDYNTENEKLIKKRQECKNKANPAATKQDQAATKQDQAATKQGQQPVPTGKWGIFGFGGRKSSSSSSSSSSSRSRSRSKTLIQKSQFKKKNELKEIDMVMETLYKRIHSNKNEEYKKKAVLIEKILEENTHINKFFKKNKKIIKKNEFINILCLLTADMSKDEIDKYYVDKIEEINGGSPSRNMTKYKSAKYFNYDRKYFKNDVIVLCYFLISIILIYLSYSKFLKFLDFTDVANLKYGYLLDKNLDNSELTYISYILKLIYNAGCNVTTSISGKLINDFKNNLIDITSFSAAEMHDVCFSKISDDLPVMNYILNAVETYYNPSAISNCEMQVIAKNLNAAFAKFSFDLNMAVTDLNSARNYLMFGSALGVRTILYLKCRLGITVIPKRLTNGPSRKAISLGGRGRKYKTQKKTRKNY